MMNRGSEWRRWEPHIHAPGTVMNNQFGGPNAWHDYLTVLEQATPLIEAIAVTDYYVTDTYDEVLRHKAAWRLPNAKLIFPNVELRLDVATAKGGFVNIHLLVSPEDPQHVQELRRLLSRLSPGTRGIVLLLLYLALDDSDNRPLVIDQPEENLDPKSVFDELITLFIEAKSHRQVIMVTHNANLVVNTDADQIIIAESGPHPHGALPPISYRSGRLENSEIRRAVCDILEGGEGAFQERARRLRVRLER
jgi:hypothetical protein